MRRRRKLSAGVLLLGVLSSVVSLLSDQSGVSAPRSESAGAGAAKSSASLVVGKVIRVLDGDTVEILRVDGAETRPLRIRLAGIDAPEKSQAFGEVCRKSLAEKVAGRDVRVEVRGNDQYSRALGVIFVPAVEGKGSDADANLAQIATGCAWHYKQYEKQQRSEDRTHYAQAEVAAREKRLGLWRDPNPQAPWDFRKKHRSRRQRRIEQ